MSKFSVIFNPATDNKAEVLAQVEQMFAIFGALGGTAAASAGQLVVNPANDTATGEDEPGTATTATHDKTGLPWDARIHSTPPALTGKEVWRAKRGVDKQLVAQVEAELRATAGGVATNPIAAMTAAAAASTAPAAAPTLPVMSAPTLPVVSAPALPVVAAPAVPTTYEQLVNLVSENLNSESNPAGRITNEWVTASLAAYSVSGSLLPNVASMPETAQAEILAGFKAALGL